MQDEFVKEGLSVKITPCANPMNPRVDMDCNSAVFVMAHRRYKIGDPVQEYSTSDYHSWEAMKAAIEENEKPLVIKPVFMLDHSGLSLSTKPFSCSWDSGQVGWVFVPASSGLSQEQAEFALEAEFDAYNAYVEGGMHDVSIEDMLSGEPVMQEFSMTREQAESSVDSFFSQRSKAV